MPDIVGQGRKWYPGLRLILLLTLLVPAAATAKRFFPRAKNSPHDRQAYRQHFVNPEALIPSLGITEGMTIVDIGSGPGYVSVVFAEALKGTGMVFATDISVENIGFVEESAKRKDLKNLKGVLVTDDGLDAFYTQHHFDLVFLCNVYHSINDRLEYFRKLKQQLNPGARMVVVMYNQGAPFAPEDFIDPAGLAREFSGATKEGPITGKLSAETLAAARGFLSSPNEESKKVLFIENLRNDFNAILREPRFVEGLLHDGFFISSALADPANGRKAEEGEQPDDGRFPFTTPERDLVNWLMMGLAEEGVFEPGAPAPEGETLRNLMKLNRLLLSKRFGRFLIRGGMGARLPHGDGARHFSKYMMVRELDQVGYRPAKEMSLSAYYDAVIMVPK